MSITEIRKLCYIFSPPQIPFENRDSWLSEKNTSNFLGYGVAWIHNEGFNGLRNTNRYYFRGGRSSVGRKQGKENNNQNKSIGYIYTSTRKGIISRVLYTKVRDGCNGEKKRAGVGGEGSLVGGKGEATNI